MLSLKLIIPSLLCASIMCGEISISNLSLNDAEEIAKEYNKQFLIAKETTNQADERKLQAISRYLPSIHYRAEFRDIAKKELFFDIFSDTPTFSHRGYSSILELDQPIFSTDLFFNIKGQKKELESIRYEQAATFNELLRAVRQNYYAVISLEIALDIERENIDYLSMALDCEQKRLQAGNSTILEVNQSKVALSNAISSYYLTLKELKNARNAFIFTLGIDPILEPKLVFSEKKIPIYSIPEISLKLQEIENEYRYQGIDMPSTQDFLTHINKIENAKELVLFSEREVLEYLDTALKYRPDLQKSKIQIDVASERLKEKQGHYLPKIDGYVRYSYNDTYLGTVPFNKEPYYLSGGLTFSWNLFDSLLREHEIKEAKSVRQSYRINYDKNFQKVEVEIRNGLYQLEESIMAYLSSSTAVLYAEQAREQAFEKLQFGKIIPLEYRDSVNLLAQAKNQNNKATFDLISAHYQLRYALGLDAISH